MVKGVRKFKVPEACDHKSDSFGIRETRTKKGTRIDETTGSSESNGRNEEMFVTKKKRGRNCSIRDSQTDRRANFYSPRRD